MKDITAAAISFLDHADLIDAQRDFLLEARIHHSHMTRYLNDLCSFLRDLVQDILEQNSNLESANRALRCIERDWVRMSIPAWFWRPEEDVELKVTLYRRARFLIEEVDAPTDDIFEILRELVSDVIGPAEMVSDSQIVNIIEYAARKGAENADG